MLGSIIGAAGGLLGGALDAHYSRGQTRMAQAFQREVLQNQLQWRAADAKKAGLHPLAALGTSAASGAVGTAGVGSTFSDALGKLGEGIGDGFYAYMTKEERAQAAAKEQEQKDRLFDGNLRLIEAQIAETLARAKSYTVPVASGREVVPGQVDAGDTQQLFTFGVDGRGKVSRVYPSDFMTSAWEDRPAGTSVAPLAEAEALEQDAKIRGTVVNGRVWSVARGEFVPVRSRDGQRALAYWRTRGSLSRPERALMLPKSDLDKRFFQWLDNFVEQMFGR